MGREYEKAVMARDCDPAVAKALREAHCGTDVDVGGTIVTVNEIGYMNKSMPCVLCVFSVYGGAGECAYSTCCMAHLRPNRRSVIFVEAHNGKPNDDTCDQPQGEKGEDGDNFQILHDMKFRFSRVSGDDKGYGRVLPKGNLFADKVVKGKVFRNAYRGNEEDNYIHINTLQELIGLAESVGKDLIVSPKAIAIYDDWVD